jgi:hypothetical protein
MENCHAVLHFAADLREAAHCVAAQHTTDGAFANGPMVIQETHCMTGLADHL